MGTAQEQCDTSSKWKTKQAEGPTKDLGTPFIFAFLLWHFIVVHFSLLFMLHWRPGHSEHAVSHHLTRMLPLPEHKNAQSHTHFLSLSLRKGSYSISGSSSSSWLPSESLIECPSLAICLMAISAVCLATSSAIRAISKRSCSRLGTGPSIKILCFMTSLSNVVIENLNVTRVFSLIAKLYILTPNQVNLDLSPYFDHCISTAPANWVISDCYK